ncbi:hypothetical protein [Arundinibacter roseus]|uniref:Uncharacterized protein n=1 Tax=Arundinibacter roseus TaxID=2070510 RepID=A0A4V2X9M6_9BACT|nr:hypothetical protein [Arundinibacter roseus]TDB64385.1 hypothetical protein EZE20_11925 [Arundinibacter roseus]
MEPIKIKINSWHVQHVLHFCENAAAMANNPNAADDLIVLAEYSPKMRTVYYSKGLKGKKLSTVSIPVSIARIIHRRWQQGKVTQEMQEILSAIDYELTARNLKPDPSKCRIDF